MVIKVCGMRDPKNIAQIAGLDTDLLGFIFYEKSKRYIEDLPPNVPHTITRVGVFVNQSQEYIERKLWNNDIFVAQLHGDESPELCYKLMKNGIQVIKAFRISPDFDFNMCNDYINTCSHFLFDTAGKEYGGTGEKFDWNILQNYKAETGFFLSGGIRPEDAYRISEFRHPKFAGIDINSGFEIEPGLKDFAKVQEFVHNIRKI